MGKAEPPIHASVTELEQTVLSDHACSLPQQAWVLIADNHSKCERFTQRDDENGLFFFGSEGMY